MTLVSKPATQLTLSTHQVEEELSSHKTRTQFTHIVHMWLCALPELQPQQYLLGIWAPPFFQESQWVRQFDFYFLLEHLP